MKLHEILIMIGFIGLVTIGFGLLWVDGATHYGTTDLDQSRLSHINSSLATINENAQGTEEAMTQLTTPNSAFDIVGGLLFGGYGVIITTLASFGLLHGITGDLVSFLPLGGLMNPFILFVGMCLFVIIGVAILGHYISKSDRM